ncbi:tRNA (adenosine(37)-N6)-threonylcarbamoyltransferase complex ATPase subunit type 1 TsaE [Uliginosibacterium sp. sgz301328]|uniref:tRNA (adenosine(37)-N6)-threonylcarbamoyltransferase complex ATPase subunit type 1 TsaE n=1 Tax=Uliginosibacterium sp. sgz301328 TaxID=3243764 RepID=UPI00359EAFDD
MSAIHAPDDSAKVLYLQDESATEALGAWLADVVEPGLVIWLSGDLGAGKTTLTRGLLRALGHAGSVKSPTYTLIEPYVVSKIPLYHFDFYRFSDPEEFLDAGLEEYFAGDAVCLVEWADKAGPYVPRPDIEIRLVVEGNGRRAECRGVSERGRACLNTSKSIPASIRGEPS